MSVYCVAPRLASDPTVREFSESFQFHDDDVLVSTYHKSGTTLTQEIVSCLLYGVEKTRATDQSVRSPFIDFREPGAADPLEQARAMQSPRVLKTHLPAKYHRRHLKQSVGPKNVIVIRNPKDVLVSKYHHFHGTKVFSEQVPKEFPDFWRAMVYQPRKYGQTDYFEFNLGWWAMRDHPRVLVLFYEDLLRDKATQVRRLADFIGVPLTDQLLKETIQATSIQAMRSNPNANVSGGKGASGWKAGVSFIRRGEVGDWKNHLTVADNAELDRAIQERMLGAELDFVYE